MAQETLPTEKNPPRLTPTQAPEIPRAALKLKEAAAALGVTPLTVRNLIDRGLLKRNKALRHVLISTREIDRFLADNQ